ncbi:MAG TPA: STAS domain-containing protein [Solirubrobacteraceae bacterium]|nr:STAS domain-containing protein [Solirubrobacteraceae bacterium]
MSTDPPPILEIHETLEPTGVRLRLTGELDVAVVGRLQDRLRSLARVGESVRLDLSALTFVDSSGLNAIITAFRGAQRDGWELQIEPTLSPPVHKVVTMMGLDQVFWP